jgi:hypothetical protein
MDLVGASMMEGTVAWWENTDGLGTNWTEHTVSEVFTGARYVDAADLDQDGDLDLFGAAASLDAIVWWENTSGAADQWTPHEVDTDFDFAMHVFAADVDQDGDLDLMGAALKGDMITWWENTEGDGSVWNEQTIDDTFDGARHVCALDLDGDGDIDLLGSASIANTIMWWENTAGDATTWLPHTVDGDYPGVNTVQPVDIDGDGDPDLLATADVADAVTWWENTNGDASTWERHTIDDNFDGAFSTHAADIDGDGDLDVLAGAAEADIVSWWENITGAGDIWAERMVDDFYIFPMFIGAADVDHDGDMDVVGGNFDGDVVWWENETSLPVELVYFDAVLDERTIHLRWETASETNNAGFEIQHLSPGIDDETDLDWESVSFVEGAGTVADGQVYRFRFENAAPGRHRFRLKQVDFDGQFDYSPTVDVVILAWERGALSDAYPNPFNPSTRFSLTVAMTQRVDIGVYNMLGQRVASLHEGLLLANEAHAFEFEANELPGGMYLIRAQGEDFTDTRQAMLVK